ncbi:MAG TPA: outer membrane protein transport protein [Xanthomonadaceae bacterium]|jgi:long-chain fatty acid transport protein
MRKSNSVTISSLAVAVVAALACGQAMASGFQIREDSIDAMSRSHAGSASDWGDAAVVANNPAAMSLFDKNTFQTDLTAIDLHGQFSGAGEDLLGNPLTGGNGGDLGDTTPVPAFDVIFPFGNGFTLGASVTAPFGLKTQYDPDWIGRYEAIKSELKTVDLTFAGSYKFNDMFSAGLSIISQRADAELSNAVDFGTLLYVNGGGPLGFTPQSADGFARIKGNDTSWGWDVGFLFRPTPNTNIGLNYRSKIDHDINGHADFDVPSNVQAVLALNPATASLFQNTGANASISTPSVVTLSLSQKLSSTFTISADIERTNWGVLKNLVVNFDNPAQPPSVEVFDWKDSTEFAIGADWQFDPHWVLRAGYAHDETPTSNATRDPRLPDNNRNLYSLGLGWMPNDNVEWNIGFSHIAIDKPSIFNINLNNGSVLAGTYTNADANLYGVSATFHF